MKNEQQSRREFLKTSGACLTAGITGATGVRSVLAAQPKDGADLARPTKAQQVWQDCEIGLIYHFDLPIAAGEFASNNTVKHRLDPKLYNPTRLNTDQWIEAAKGIGAQYAIFTATHFNGFMQWQSDLYPYGVKQARWRDGKGDVVGDFVESCRKADILPGVYFSTHRNVFWEVWDYYVDWGKGKGTPAQETFNRVAEKMTEELCSRYGPLVQIWYDAGVKTPAEGGPDVLPIFERHQPDSVFYHNMQRSDHRYIGNEKGHAGDPCWATMPSQDGEVSLWAKSWRPHLHSGVADGDYWSPAMVDVPLRGTSNIHNWFWNPGQDHAVESLETLMKMYDQSVGRNCNFIIGEVVNSEGLVPEHDLKRLTDFGKVLRRRFANPLGETEGNGMSVELPLRQPAKVDQVVIMEDIAHGERVREYAVEGMTGDDTWQTLARGQSIGHKWIYRFEPVSVAKLRLRISKAVASPVIRKFAAYGNHSKTIRDQNF